MKTDTRLTLGQSEPLYAEVRYTTIDPDFFEQPLTGINENVAVSL